MTEDTDRLHELRTMPYDEYLQTPEWLERREQALDRAERRCQVCNTPDNLNVHHRTYERRGHERPGDLTVLCETHHALFHLSQRISNESVGTNAAEAIMDVVERTVDQEMKHRTGYKDLNRLLTEWRRGSLYVVAGFPHTGKSNVLLNLAHHSAQNKKHVLLLSLEMDTDIMYMRVLATRTDTDLQDLQQGWLHDDQIVKIAETALPLESLPLFITSPTITTFPALKLHIAEHIRQHGPIDLLMLDNLNMIEPEEAKKETASQHAQSLCRGLKLLARQYNIPIIASCPLTTSRDRSSYYTTFQDIRNSGWGATEVYADAILALYRNELYNPDTERKNLIDITVLRNRQGPVGEATLFFWGDRAIVRDLEKPLDTEE